MSEDYRAILGVSWNASASEIRAAYRRAAKKAHPDLGGSSEAFRLVRTAADVLLGELKAGTPTNPGRPDRSEDRTGLGGHWTTVIGSLRTKWGLMHDPVTVFAPQKVGLSPFVTGAILNQPAFNWLTWKVGPRGQGWDFHTADSVTRIFFRHGDDARQFKMRFP